MKMNLEKGDPCFVRLNDGEVVEVRYERLTDQKNKIHEVKHLARSLYATHLKIFKYSNYECVFVYPISEMKKQMRLQ